jgi:hypothetical protein
MPTAASRGTTSFRDYSVDSNKGFDGPDTLTVTRRGAVGIANANLNAELAQWRRGAAHSSYRNMFLQTVSWQERGPVCDVILNYLGYLDATDTDGGVIDITDDIAEESVTITTSTGENVNFRYFAQTATTRWISRSRAFPTRPRFPGVVPTSLPVGLLRQPNPPKYTGSIAGKYKLEGVLAGFQRTRIAKAVWAVTETWKNLVEPEDESDS